MEDSNELVSSLKDLAKEGINSKDKYYSVASETIIDLVERDDVSDLDKLKAFLSLKTTIQRFETRIFINGGIN